MERCNRGRLLGDGRYQLNAARRCLKLPRVINSLHESLRATEKSLQGGYTLVRVSDMSMIYCRANATHGPVCLHANTFDSTDAGLTVFS